VQAVRQADLSHYYEHYNPVALSHYNPTTSLQSHHYNPALRGCVAGEGEPPLELLLAAVACAASGEVLCIPVQQLREGDLVELDLSRRRISVDGVRLLVLLLESNSTLQSLNVGYNDLTEEEVLNIVHIEQQRNELTTLGLAQSTIGPAGAKEIAEWILASAMITSLDLRFNSIGNEGAGALGKALESNSTLQSLNLSDNSIGAIGAQALGKALETNSTLKELYVGFNYCSYRL